MQLSPPHACGARFEAALIGLAKFSCVLENELKEGKNYVSLPIASGKVLHGVSEVQSRLQLAVFWRNLEAILQPQWTGSPFFICNRAASDSHKLDFNILSGALYSVGPMRKTILPVNPERRLFRVPI